MLKGSESSRGIRVSLVLDVFLVGLPRYSDEFLWGEGWKMVPDALQGLMHPHVLLAF